jgi:hypothetical protein
MGNRSSHTVDNPAGEIDSNTARHDGFNGTSPAGSSAVEVKKNESAASADRPFAKIVWTNQNRDAIILAERVGFQIFFYPVTSRRSIR